MTAQLIFVPRISSLPAHEAKARALLRWLVRSEIVEELPTTCGQGGDGMAYAIGPGARRIAQHPERLPYGQAHNGLEIVTQRCIYVPTRDFLGEAGCPDCRQEVGVPLFDSLEAWWPGETDVFTCPECGFEDDINGFLFLQPCGFSNLGFIFNGWAEAGLSGAFVEAFAERLGFACAQVRVDP
ncbi:sugar ABC transporter ATPase [Stutzerimonas nitrititolerans]|uniref:sugar ABC transporter ATPase n=1 Tax=Stutzerimonas nitrititolerans TaxID=2482751 RepID=UPI00289AA5DF|nr:sugar ABC transporter ATPase [Stutzerimonas nitrititolerans]